MREIHWHTDSDEWNFFIAGNARITVFSAPESSRTFDFAAGDVGYVPFADTHYVENTGDVDVVYLEVLQAPKFTGLLFFCSVSPQDHGPHTFLPSDPSNLRSG